MLSEPTYILAITHSLLLDLKYADTILVDGTLRSSHEQEHRFWLMSITMMMMCSDLMCT